MYLACTTLLFGIILGPDELDLDHSQKEESHSLKYIYSLLNVILIAYQARIEYI